LIKTEKQIRFHLILSIVVRFILGGIFIFAGIPKILDSASFAGVVYNYQLLPDGLVNIVAIVLPWIEVVSGGLIILGIWMPGTVLLYNLLMFSFICALVFNTARGLDINCGCFSTQTESGININTILRDVGFLCLSLYLLFVIFSKKIPNAKIFSKESWQNK
jgi:uncharacterized membrane protein YphA (DoxX/SURF4 family)